MTAKEAYLDVLDFCKKLETEWGNGIRTHSREASCAGSGW